MSVSFEDKTTKTILTLSRKDIFKILQISVLIEKKLSRNLKQMMPHDFPVLLIFVDRFEVKERERHRRWASSKLRSARA